MHINDISGIGAGMIAGNFAKSAATYQKYDFAEEEVIKIERPRRQCKDNTNS